MYRMWNLLRLPAVRSRYSRSILRSSRAWSSICYQLNNLQTQPKLTLQQLLKIGVYVFFSFKNLTNKQIRVILLFVLLLKSTAK